MIEVAAVVIRNPQGHVLTVRKKSSTKYQLPGGKPEAGEVVVGTIFTYTRTVTADEPHAAAEIGDTAWVNPAAPDRDLCSLARPVSWYICNKLPSRCPGGHRGD